MPWTWRYEKADGAVVAADDLQEAIFVSQGDAESWLGENWRALLAIGVDQVTLLEDARTEYGPMSLHPEDVDLVSRPDPGAGIRSLRICRSAGWRTASGPSWARPAAAR